MLYNKKIQRIFIVVDVELIEAKEAYEKSKETFENTLIRQEKIEREKTSKQLACWLRHHPEYIGIELDNEGWTGLNILIKNANEQGFPFDLGLIEATVRSSDKQRFTIKDGKIRANQGHSVDVVNIKFTKAVPPDVLYHGTAFKIINKIFKEGLDKMKRHHVHLSETFDVAWKVGQRHGKPVVIQIDAKRMVKDSIDFYKSDNNIWLVDNVHTRYFIERILV